MQPALRKMCPNYYNEAKKFHPHCPHPTSGLRKACSFIGNTLAPVNPTLGPFLPAEGPATVSQTVSVLRLKVVTSLSDA